VKCLYSALKDATEHRYLADEFDWMYDECNQVIYAQY